MEPIVSGSDSLSNCYKECRVGPNSIGWGGDAGGQPHKYTANSTRTPSPIACELQGLHKPVIPYVYRIGARTYSQSS